MGFAHGEIRALSQANAPFLLSVLTLDTHQPEGHPSKTCEPYLADDNPMLQAVHCSDQILGAFLEKQLPRDPAKNTVYVFFFDHLSNRNTVYDTLFAQGDTRRLSFMAWGADQIPMRDDAPLTHFYIAISDIFTFILQCPI